MEPGGAGKRGASSIPVDDRRGALVTPEAILVDLSTATIGSRCLAKALDLLIEIVAAALLLAIPTVLGLGGAVLVVTASIVSFLILFAYPAVWEARWRGRTPGKAALGLRVVSDEGGPIGPRHAIIRAVLGPVDVIGGAASMLLSSRDRRLGDLVAGTLVLRDRSEAVAGPPFWFSAPPGWEGFTESLGTLDITSTEQAVIRSFLLRWAEFSPPARLDLAAWLARPLVNRLGHQVPAAMPPDLYLLCLTVARQNQDHRRSVPAPPSSSPPAHDAGPLGPPGVFGPAPVEPAPVGSAPVGSATPGWGPPAGRPVPTITPPA